MRITASSLGRRVANMEARVSPPVPGLGAIVAAMPPADRKVWDEISDRINAADDPRLPIDPDTFDTWFGLLATTMERRGIPINTMWREGFSLRYRCDWEDFHARRRLGSLVGMEVLTGPVAERTDEPAPARPMAPDRGYRGPGEGGGR